MTVREAMPGIADVARSVLESISDIDPSVEPAICSSVSLGMAFEAVPVVLRR